MEAATACRSYAPCSDLGTYYYYYYYYYYYFYYCSIPARLRLASRRRRLEPLPLPRELAPRSLLLRAELRLAVGK